MAEKNKNPSAETDTKVEEVAKESKDIQQELGELTNHLQRLQAEFENYRKRVEEERKESKNAHTVLLLQKIIPIIDHFETALQHPCSDKNYEEGMKMIHQLFFTMLDKEQVVMSNPINKKFDPKLHEAVGTENTADKDDNTIIRVTQRGYTYKDVVLQRARVIVNKRNNETKQTN